MTSSDAINAVEDGGNDSFWGGTIGLALAASATSQTVGPLRRSP